MTGPRRGITVEETEERSRPRSSAPSRWSISASGLDLFWPILLVILAMAVVFCVSVAQASMKSVGGAPVPASGSQPQRSVDRASRLLIVQVSSYPTMTRARAAAQALADDGYEPHVLDSDDYQPLNSGYYVVYTGPYPETAAGRAEAKRIQGQLPGALVRDIQAR